MQLWLALAALIPAAALGFYIWKKDAREKEPKGLLVRLLLSGVAVILPVILAETSLGWLTDLLFGVRGEGAGLPAVAFVLYQLVYNFLVVALAEEGCKWLAVRLLTANNKNFNCLFDGLVYCVFVSLGFAAAENVKYVFAFGFSTALVRAVTAVPGHVFFAVLMGRFYSEWHVLRASREMERRFALEERIPVPSPSSFDPKRANVLSLAVPVLAHGTYDFLLSFSGTALSGVFTVLFYLYLAALYALCFLLVSRMSKQDALSAQLSLYRVFRRYPGLEEAMHAEELERQARLDALRAAGVEPEDRRPKPVTGLYTDPEARRQAEEKYGDIFAKNGSSVGYRRSDAYVEAEKRHSFVEAEKRRSFVEQNPSSSSVAKNPTSSSVTKK